MKRAWLSTCILLFLSACSTISYVNIETYKPAEVTFPVLVNKVLIVNNAEPQPADIGYEYDLMGTKQDTARAKADSALFDAAHSLGLAILDTDYFSDVLLYHDSPRTDDDYLTDQKLTQSSVKNLCEENDVEAVISIDRLLFDMEKTVAAIGSNYFMGVIRLRISAIMRAYIPDRATPLATVLLTDSIFWAEEAGSIEALNSYLPTPDNALREGAKYIGEMAAPNFVPHWQNEVRWFYTGGTTEWRQASAYASAQRWDDADKIWKKVYDKTSSPLPKAKVATNIAFAQEMMGNYEEALQWAEIAVPLFQKEGESSGDYQLITQYVIALKERIRENKKLMIQFGE